MNLKKGEQIVFYRQCSEDDFETVPGVYIGPGSTPEYCKVLLHDRRKVTAVKAEDVDPIVIQFKNKVKVVDNV